jgi:hypothetical protein
MGLLRRALAPIHISCAFREKSLDVTKRLVAALLSSMFDDLHGGDTPCERPHRNLGSNVHAAIWNSIKQFDGLPRAWTHEQRWAAILALVNGGGACI